MSGSREKIDYKMLGHLISESRSGSRAGSRGASNEFNFKMLGDDGGIYSGRADDILKTERSDRSDSSPEETNDVINPIQIDLRFSKNAYKLSHDLLVSIETIDQELDKSQIAANKKAVISKEDDLLTILQKLEDENIVGVFQLIDTPNKKEVKQLAKEKQLRVQADVPFGFGRGAFGRVILARRVIGLKKLGEFSAVKEMELGESNSDTVKKLSQLDSTKEAEFLKFVAKKTNKEGLSPIFLPITHSLVTESSQAGNLAAYQFMPLVNLGNGDAFREIFWSKTSIDDRERTELRRYIISKLFNLVTRLHRFQRCRIFHGDLKPSNYLLHFDDQLHIYLCDPGSAVLLNHSGEIDNEKSPNGQGDDVHAPPENIILRRANKSDYLLIFDGLSKQEIYELDEAWRFGLIYLSLIDNDLYNKFKETAANLAKNDIIVQQYNDKNPEKKKPVMSYTEWRSTFIPLYEEIKKLNLVKAEKKLLLGFLHYDFSQRKKLLGLNWNLSVENINPELCYFLLEAKYNPRILKAPEAGRDIRLQFSFDKACYLRLSHTLLIDIQFKNFLGEMSGDALVRFIKREISKDNDLAEILYKLNELLKPYEHTICIFQLMDALNEEERSVLAAQSPLGEGLLKKNGYLARQVINSHTQGEFLLIKKIKQQEVDFLEAIKTKAGHLADVFIPQIYHLQVKSIKNEKVAYQILPIARRYNGVNFIEGFWSGAVSDGERIQLRQYIFLKLLPLVLTLMEKEIYPNLSPNDYILGVNKPVTLHLYRLDSGVILNTAEESTQGNYFFGKRKGIYAPPESKFPHTLSELSLQQKNELKVAWQFGLIYLSLIDKKIFSDFIALACKLKKLSKQVRRHNRTHAEKKSLNYDECKAGYTILYDKLTDRLAKIGIANEEKELLLGLLHYDVGQRKLLSQIQCQFKKPADRAVQPLLTKIARLTPLSIATSMRDNRKAISDDSYTGVHTKSRPRAITSISTPSSPTSKAKSSSDISHNRSDISHNRSDVSSYKLAKDDTALTEGGIKSLRTSLLNILRGGRRDDVVKEKELGGLSASNTFGEVSGERKITGKPVRGTPESLRRVKSQDTGMSSKPSKQISEKLIKRSSVIIIPSAPSSPSNSGSYNSIPSSDSNRTSADNSPRTPSGNSPSGSRGKFMGFLHHLSSSSGSTNVSPSSSKTPSPRERDALPKSKTPPSPSKPGKGH